VTAVANSDQRLGSLARRTAAFGRSSSPADALAVVRVLGEITTLDRARSSSGSRGQTLAAAEPAHQAVMGSHAKLSRLSAVAGTAETARTPGSERDLVAAVGAVSPFDEGVATAEEGGSESLSDTSVTAEAKDVGMRRHASGGLAGGCICTHACKHTGRQKA
jgi:hypothetical protein